MVVLGWSMPASKAAMMHTKQLTKIRVSTYESASNADLERGNQEGPGKPSNLST
jgi:hypothetical protein